MDRQSPDSSLSARLIQSVFVIVAALFLNLAAAGSVVAGPVFTTSLSGLEEVSPNASTASGSATFTFNDALTELSYEVSVFGLVDITMAHIHLAPAGVNGPVVLWLYPFSAPAQLIPGETNGVLSQRTVTAADLVGVLSGQPLSALMAEMSASNAYVNIHTVAFPGGEIRGQIQPVPAPAMLPLVAAGLLLLISRRRRRAIIKPQ